MEMNPLITSSTLKNSTIISNTQTTTTTGPSTTTTPVVYNFHPFLQTAACQSVAGAFTWAAIFITGYHVKIDLKNIHKIHSVFLFLFL